MSKNKLFYTFISIILLFGITIYGCNNPKLKPEDKAISLTQDFLDKQNQITSIIANIKNNDDAMNQKDKLALLLKDSDALYKEMKSIELTEEEQSLLEVRTGSNRESSLENFKKAIMALKKLDIDQEFYQIFDQ